MTDETKIKRFNIMIKHNFNVSVHADPINNPVPSSSFQRNINVPFMPDIVIVKNINCLNRPAGSFFIGTLTCDLPTISNSKDLFMYACSSLTHINSLTNVIHKIVPNTTINNTYTFTLNNIPNSVGVTNIGATSGIVNFNLEFIKFDN